MGCRLFAGCLGPRPLSTWLLHLGFRSPSATFLLFPHPLQDPKSWVRREQLSGPHHSPHHHPTASHPPAQCGAASPTQKLLAVDVALLRTSSTLSISSGSLWARVGPLPRAMTVGPVWLRPFILGQAGGAPFVTSQGGQSPLCDTRQPPLPRPSPCEGLRRGWGVPLEIRDPCVGTARRGTLGGSEPNRSGPRGQRSFETP